MNSPHRWPSVPEMQIQISKRSEVPIREQLGDQIVFLIATEKLEPGAILPSVRVLARRLKIHHNLTGPGTETWNIVVAKNFPLKAERARLQFRWEMFNAFNRANFCCVNQNMSSPSDFGLVNGANSGRFMQFALRIDY